MKKPRKLSLVRFHPRSSVGGATKHPFEPARTYVFIGELANMPGHCVVADSLSGQLFSGYHTELFVELASDEV